MLTYLAEITVYDPSISGTKTLYYSSTGFTSAPTDTPASTHYEGRLKQPGLLRRDIFSQGTTGGASTTGYGVIELVNLGDLDDLVDYGFDGRQIRILVGDKDAARSTFTECLVGTMEQAEFTYQLLSIRLRDRLAELDKPCVTTLFAGTNATGIGGDSSTTSNTIGTGSKSFTTTGVNQFVVGTVVHIRQSTNPANFMVGTVTSFAGTALVVSVVATGGTGTIAAWNISEFIVGWSDTSATSVTIGTGSKTFTTAGNYTYLAGEYVKVQQTTNSANFMLGTVTSFNGTTKALVVNVLAVGGSGAISNWSANVLITGGSDTSATSVVIGTGSKTFTTTGATYYAIGSIITVQQTTNPANFMTGTVTASSGTSVTVSVGATGGTGTIAAWTLVSLMTGVEGSENDVKGNPKPCVFGKVFNVQPIMCNASMLIYQLHIADISAVNGVYDGGVALTQGTAYSTLTELYSAAPSGGTYRVLNTTSGTYLRLGTTPVGQLTVDLTQGATAADRTVAQVLKNLALLASTLTISDIYAADLTQLDTDTGSAVVGIWLGDSGTIKDAMDQVSNSVGAWFGFDRLGRLRMAQLKAPSGVPVASFDNQDLVTIERTATSDTGKGVPAYQIKLGFQKNYTVMQVDFKAGITATRIAYLALDYRTVTATDTDVLTAHILSPILEFNTLLTDTSVAQTEASRRLALYGVRRDHLNVKVVVSQSLIGQIDLGSVIQITINRFGYSSGKLFTVIGLQPDYRTGSIDMTLWG